MIHPRAENIPDPKLSTLMRILVVTGVDDQVLAAVGQRLRLSNAARIGEESDV